MGASYLPNQSDIERYRAFRAVSLAVNHRIIKIIPARAYDEIGDALGIRRAGVLVFDSDDMSSVLMDCCVYNWFENGKTLVERYAETHPAKPGTEESYLLQALLQAKYRILVVQSVVAGAGIHCKDVLNGEELFVMDLAFSRTIPDSGMAIATRTIPLGEYSMTGGAGLPISSKQDGLDALCRIKSVKSRPLHGPGGVALPIARACLAAGAADHIMYEGPEETGAIEPPPPTRWPGFKRRRRPT